MLKYKLIRAYVAIWCVVCLLYVGARAAFGVVAGGPGEETKTTETAESTEQIEKAEAAPVTDNANVQTQAEGQGSTENVSPTSAPTQTPAPTAVVSPPVETTAPVSVSTPTEDTVQTQETSASNQQQDKPSLNEYLSQFTCGNCRRNCSLDHPRCHNGSRLAELKAQEYYETYGS